MARKRREVVNLMPWEFNPTTLKKLELKDLKAIYTQKRDIAQKRLKRLRQSEFANNQPTIDYKSGIPTLKNIKAASESDPTLEKNILTYELSKLSKWLDNEYTKLTALKERKAKSIATLHEHGYTWVNSKNYMDFVDFQNYLSKSNLDHLYDSDQIIAAANNELPDTSELKNLFDEYMENNRSLSPEYHMNR